MIALLIVISIIVLFILATILFMRLPRFGALPTGDRLKRIQRASNYKNGQFNNESITPDFTDGGTMLKVMRQFFFTRNPRSKPAGMLPTQYSDLSKLDAKGNFLCWFGHSSYFMQLQGVRILVDPVFSGAASPLPFTTPSFNGSDRYDVEDIPEIDILLLTHDHWDHLDYYSVLSLAPKAKHIVTSLGVGAHLERWGISADKFTEMEWGQELQIGASFFACCPARHFSGRTFKRAQSLWSSFVVKSGSKKIYVGADSGYDVHFKRIGEKYGPFDLALLECGQYNRFWKHIHMMPEELKVAAGELRAVRLMPVHWGKFKLALHDWDEPVRRVVESYSGETVKPVTPVIGEVVDLDKLKDSYHHWWAG